MRFCCDSIFRLPGAQAQLYSQLGVIMHQLAAEVIVGHDISFSLLTIPSVAYTKP